MKITTQQDKLWQSYLNQTYRIANQTFGPSTESNELPFKGFIISAWSPGGKEQTYKENTEQSWELEKHLKNLKLTFKKVIQVEQTRAWVEDAFLIHNISDGKARELALKFHQKAFIEIKNNQATVYETNTKAKKTIQIGQIPRLLGCPAKAEGKESNKFCSQHGYWTTGAALSAMHNWRTNLSIVTSRLGCNLCNNVTTHPNKYVQLTNPEYFNNIQVTNRFSIAQWVRLKDDNAN